jgi:hypothetical protein
MDDTSMMLIKFVALFFFARFCIWLWVTYTTAEVERQERLREREERDEEIRQQWRAADWGPYYPDKPTPCEWMEQEWIDRARANRDPVKL